MARGHGPGRQKGEPHYKHKWARVLDWPQVEGYISKSSDPRMRCIIALLWIFGKRITEVLQLCREDFRFTEDEMVVEFRVQKKKLKQGPVERTWPKAITLKHPAVKYVEPYVRGIERGYIFPSSRKPLLFRMKREFPKKQMTSYYCYRRPGGYLGYKGVYKKLKQLDDRLFFHLFRHSLATHLAKAYPDPFVLMAQFDWETPTQAMAYVQANQETLKKIAKRTDF